MCASGFTILANYLFLLNSNLNLVSCVSISVECIQYFSKNQTLICFVWSNISCSKLQGTEIVTLTFSNYV